MLTLQDAKNRFSAVVEAAINGTPQEVSRRGKPAVVVISVEEYARLKERADVATPKKTFLEHLMDIPRGPDDLEDDDLFPRQKWETREIEF
ncbi:MAG: type II toxin-antitoxin system Phd/YefM family antitoxin [Pseudomonadota bacterium]